MSRDHPVADHTMFDTINVLRVAKAIVLGLALTLPADAAFAHAKLKSTTPAANATLSASPHEVVLDFSEGVVPKFSGVSVVNSAGKPIATGLPVTGAHKSSLNVPIAETLQAGTYKVKWHAVSVDTHRTQGSFSFTVAP